MRIFLALTLILALVGCAGAQRSFKFYTEDRAEELLGAHNFVTLKEGELFTSRDPTPEFMRWLIEERGVTTFVSLRGDLSRSQQEIVQSHGATTRVFHWSASRVPPEEEVQQVLAIMENSSRSPTLVFCRGGADRTGFIRAYWRMERQGWSKKMATRELFVHGHIHRNALDEYLEKKFNKQRNP